MAIAAQQFMQAEVYGIHGSQVPLIAELCLSLRGLSAYTGFWAAKRASVLDPAITLRSEWPYAPAHPVLTRGQAKSSAG